MKSKPLILMAVSVSLAMAFAFSCSSSDDNDNSSSSSNGNSSSSVCTDNSYEVGPSLIYEGKTYETAKIGCQTWMAENLNYNATDSECYDYDPTNCVTYGRLYNWATAMALLSNCNSSVCSNQIQTKHRGICPPGWHIPSKAEWGELDHGFAVLFGGFGFFNGTFNGIGNIGYWWSASEDLSHDAHIKIVYSSDEELASGSKSDLFSVRCIQD
jgi:hypothetical protein